MTADPESGAKPSVLSNTASGHIAILDGWRALSILFVLMGHLFPIGPKRWELNGATSTAGMAIFFALSGLLITRFLLSRPDPVDFLLRRMFRILPLGWTAMIVLAIANGASAPMVAANLAFISNLMPQYLFHGGQHLWSLCVEVQFYLGMAALVFLAGRKALYLLPIICIAVTLGRIATQTPVSIFTWQRIDEIVAGGCLALIAARPGAISVLQRLPRWSSPVLLLAVLASAHPATGPLNYFRPYLTAAAIGASFYTAPKSMKIVFDSAAARYIADTSYAVYVIHGMLVESWLGSGDLFQKYAKRPLLLLATYALAHLSTFYFERPLIAVGKVLSRRRTAHLSRIASIGGPSVSK